MLCCLDGSSLRVSQDRPGTAIPGLLHSDHPAGGTVSSKGHPPHHRQATQPAPNDQTIPPE